MFELEVPHRRLAPGHLAPEQRSLFDDPDAELVAASLIPWAEHCTECAMPACYVSCDLYEPRSDGKCRRFSGGLGVVRDVPNHQGLVVRVAFKRWAQLMGQTALGLVPIRRARWLERAFGWLDRIAAWLPDQRFQLLGRRHLVTHQVRRLKQRAASEGWGVDRSLRPDYFLVEASNPGTEAVGLSLVIQNPPEAGRRPPFERRLEVRPGFNRFKVDFDDIEPHLDPADAPSRRVWLHLVPNVLRPEDEGLVLYFGMLGFVADARYGRPGSTDASVEPAASAIANAAAAPVKVVVWDLDGTLWDGILVEDGPEGVKLRPGLAEVVAELDRRGIVSSVVSRNDPEEALAQLQRFGLAEYFVFPHIGWGPKSEAVAAVVSDFGVGPDSVVFVDDSPFEREQVRRADPRIRVFDALDALELPTRPEFDPPVTSESGTRREHYRTQQVRGRALASFSGEYESFLRDCRIRLEVHCDARGCADRLHELVQRTNQLNFSGNRYTRDELDRLLGDAGYDAYALEASDRFGDYGLIGFALVHAEAPRLVDLALSCRVQGKRVEHAFLGFLLERYRERGCDRFEALYRETPRNRAAGSVFADLGFEDAGGSAADPPRRLGFDLRRAIPDDGIAEIRVAP